VPSRTIASRVSPSRSALTDVPRPEPRNHAARRAASLPNAFIPSLLFRTAANARGRSRTASIFAPSMRQSAKLTGPNLVPLSTRAQLVSSPGRQHCLAADRRDRRRKTNKRSASTPRLPDSPRPARGNGQSTARRSTLARFAATGAGKRTIDRPLPHDCLIRPRPARGTDNSTARRSTPACFTWPATGQYRTRKAARTCATWAAGCAQIAKMRRADSSASASRSISSVVL